MDGYVRLRACNRFALAPAGNLLEHRNRFANVRMFVMEAELFRQHRMILLARAPYGLLSPSWMAKEALESSGHAVFWFTPELFPKLFAGDRVDSSKLISLARRWSVDYIVVADGISCDLSAMESLGIPAIAMCSSRSEVDRTVGHSEDSYAAVWALDGVDLAEAVDAEMLVCRLGIVPPAARKIPANDIVFPPSIVCTQDATDERVAAIRAVTDSDWGSRIPVRCLGEGWPAEWHFDSDYTGTIYALASGGSFVYFTDAGADPVAEYLSHAFEILSGHPVVTCGPDAIPFSDLAKELYRLLTSIKKPSMQTDVPDTFTSSVLEAMSALDSLAGSNNKTNELPACRVVSVFGYVGKANFGDEYILSTIADRLAQRCPGTVTVAVSEDPWHTLVNRGIFAISLGDKHALDSLLKCSSAALIMAGLLFDQGTRWTMGKAEVISSVLHSDLPGIAAYVSLARLNDTPVIFYGIGAGPLELEDSKRLVRFMGTMGSRFICRDLETAKLIAASGVSERQIFHRADVAFTGSARTSAVVDAFLSSCNIASPENIIVVSLREYENVPREFVPRVARACDAMLSVDDRARLVFCLLDAGDRDITERVIERMDRASRAFIFDAGDDVDAMADMLSRASAGLSMRYHCSLLLLKKGTPCVGLGYLPKVTALYKEMGLDDFLLPMDAACEDLVAACERVVSKRFDLRPVISYDARALHERACQAEDELASVVLSSNPAASSISADEEVYLYERSFSDRELLSAQGGRRDAEHWLHNMEIWLAQAKEKLEISRSEVASLNEQIAGVNKELDSARGRIHELENSNSYKVGSLLMRVPGKIKHFFKG